MEDIEYVSSEIISERREREIKVALIELLDHIFKSAKIDYHPNRKYVHISVDSSETKEEVFNEVLLPNDRLLHVSLTTKMQEGERINESISVNIDQAEYLPLYLVQIKTIDFPTFRGNSLSLLDSNVIEVLKGENHIGQYCCSNNKDRNAAYLHFKKYEFIPAGS